MGTTCSIEDRDGKVLMRGLSHDEARAVAVQLADQSGEAVYLLIPGVREETEVLPARDSTRASPLTTLTFRDVRLVRRMREVAAAHGYEPFRNLCDAALSNDDWAIARAVAAAETAVRRGRIDEIDALRVIRSTDCRRPGR